MRVLVLQLDGSLPNLAVMRLIAFHRKAGDEVVVGRTPESFDQVGFDRVYASAIFKYSSPLVDRTLARWPDAIVGGTGSGSKRVVEEIVGDDFEFQDFALFPEFRDSIGFTQRGCRLSCKFCVVPEKEGKPKSVKTIADIWRGPGFPKKLHILDNDFFGQPEWRERIAEIKDGGFRVCLSQGINVRLIDDESAAALASIQYRDTKFQRRRLYTAWDNFKDFEVFAAGVERLAKAGIPHRHLMVYMLIGFDPNETWERIWIRFKWMADRGMRPYPMVFDRSRADLKSFARWANIGLYRMVRWTDYKRQTKSPESVEAYRKVYAAELAVEASKEPTIYDESCE